MSTPTDSSVYYHGVYWNSYDEVVRHLNRLAFDSPDGTWCEFVRTEHGQPYRRALSLNCGTGWVERDLVAAGAVDSLVGVDFLDDLLASARQASDGLPIEYHQVDTNRASFPPGPYDLVVNHAAGHHITYLDRVYRELHRLLYPAGTLATWDYTGPHRNQYESRIWDAACEANSRLPVAYRASMAYPHLPTMLADDPTEAVHSELVLETMHRYFRVRHFRRLGGPIAYLVLTHNEKLHSAPEPERTRLVAEVLQADVDHVARHPEDSLFTFALASPRPESEFDAEQLAEWTHQEAAREHRVAFNAGRYYLPTSVEIACYGGAVVEPDTGSIATNVNEVARLGPGFALSALARALANRFPVTLPVLRRVRSVLRRVTGR
jgi:SAM-dependent methyltransferase